jgi:hypothetical protein
MLGSCGSSSGFVADHWPHWAGGEPDGLPPRPGKAGYDDFIAHGQPRSPAATDAPPGTQPQQAAGAEVKPQGENPAAPQQRTDPRAPGDDRSRDDSNVVQGGLY